MKILIIGNGGIGNIDGISYVNKHTASFCEELVVEKFDVAFLQFATKMISSGGQQDATFNKNIQLYTLLLKNDQNNMNKVFSYIKMNFLLIKTLRKYDFIYIFHPGHVPSLAISLCNLMQIDYALYVRGAYNTSSKLEKIFIKNAKFILTVSQFLKDQLLELNSDVEIISPMIDFTAKDIVTDKKDVTLGTTKCLFVGRIEKRKGIFVLAEVIKQLSKNGLNFSFDIVGSGEDLKSLTSVLRSYENVTIHGQVSDKAKLFSLYQHADMFIFPTYYPEGFPRVIYEAMIAGTPIITTNAGGIGGMMKDEYNCLIVEQNNVDSLYLAITKLNESSSLKERIVTQSTRDVSAILNGGREKHSKLVIDKIGELNC